MTENQIMTHLEFDDMDAMELFVSTRLLESQRLYSSSEAYDTMLSTGVGSGKTTMLAIKAMRLALMTENNYGLIGRDTQTNLESTTMKDFYDLLPADRVVESKRGKDSYVKLANVHGGTSEIVFKYLNPSKPGTKHLSGLNLGFFAGDQLEDCHTDSWDYLYTRLRRNISGPRFAFGLANPKGRDWIYKRWFQPAIKGEPGTKIERSTVKGIYTNYTGTDVYPLIQYWSTKGRYAIQSTTFENIHLPPDYIEGILRAQSREYIDRYLLASFDEWGGKIYKVFREDSDHIIHPFLIPPTWPCIVTIDVGGDSPWAILTLRMDPVSGDVFVTNEFHKPTVSIDEIVGYIKDPERSGVPRGQRIRYICDPENKPVIMELILKGILCEAARKGPKVPGIFTVAGYMQPKKNKRRLIPNQPTPGGGRADKIVENAPHLFVFNRCPMFIAEHNDWQWERDARTNEATNKPEDKNDHTCDALIYGLRVLPPVEKLPQVSVELQRLKNIDIHSYNAAMLIKKEKMKQPAYKKISEMFAGETGGTDEVYNNPDSRKKPW